MVSKLARLLVPLSLLALAMTAPVPSHAAGCYMTCYNSQYQQDCVYYPPGSPEEQACASYIAEGCRCQCFPQYCY